MSQRHYRLFATCAALFASAPQVQAQQEQKSSGTIQEVIVTAERRESSLQETPIAISVMDASALADRGITDLEGIVTSSPSMSFTPFNPSSNTLALFMRGSGVQDPGQITIDTAVGLYQDGFYISRAQMVTFDLADIERVEVLRGPQGTLYGRNTTGGAVNLISKKPSGVLGFKQELGIGNNGRFRSLTALDLPKWGGLAAKLTFLKRHQDGFVSNLGSSNDFGQDDQTAGRLALRWDTGGPFTADYFFEMGDLDSTPAYYTNSALVGLIPGYSDSGRPNDRSYRAIDLPESQGEFQSHGLTLAWEVNDALTLKSLTGYRDLSTTYFQDYAESFFVGFRSMDDIQSHQFSQELQAVGSLFDGGIEYIVGLYHFEEAGRHFQNSVITEVLPPPLLLDKNRYVSMESESQAVFAQATWTPQVLDERLDLTFGARYTMDKRSAERRTLNTYFGVPIAVEPAPGFITSNDVESSRFNPAFTANFAWTDDVNTYVRIATGYKAGGSTEGVDVGRFGQVFAPEDVTLYELGLKSYLFDRSVRLNAAAFVSEYEDMQLFFPTNPADLSVTVAVNAGKASIRGLELEALWEPIENLSLKLDYTYLDPKYDEVPAPAGTIFDPASNPASPYLVGQDAREVFSFGYAPENSLDASVNWTFMQTGNGDLTAILDYRWKDRTFHTSGAGPAVPNHLLASRPSFGLLDARLSWRMEFGNQTRARVDLWAKNVTDKEWPVYVIASGSPVPVLDPSTGLVSPAGFQFQPIAWAERRTYGINLVYEF